MWVTFPLGRPLGNPGDAAFQKDVLMHTLALLEYSKGPVLVDYPHDADAAAMESSGLACPVSFTPHKDAAAPVDKLLQRFTGEVETMKTWYEQAYQQRQRTTAQVSGLSPLNIALLFTDFITGKKIELNEEQRLSDLLRMTAEDLKAYYFEAVSAQPGQATDAQSLADWFWGETCAAAVINEARKICLQNSAKDMQLAGKLLLVPRNQVYRFTNDQEDTHSK